jgi:NADH dehydrogenase [ubiquinone] 1 alpha subcomplex assembly factor 7
VGDTLQAVKKHAFHPILDTPGEADLTAHVDFAVVGQVARSQGASIHGPVEQGQWLNRLGARVRETQLADGKSVADAALIRSGSRRLIDPDKMGRMFKVIAIGPTGSPPLSGFTADADL